MKDKARRIRIMLIGRGWARTFDSVKDASEYINISRNRIRRALESPTGVIEGTQPAICVDLPMETAEERFVNG